jgi:hypothetical protein
MFDRELEVDQKLLSLCVATEVASRKSSLSWLKPICVGGFLLLSTLKLYFYSLDLVLLDWISLNATDQCLDLFHCGIFLFKVDDHM